MGPSYLTPAGVWSLICGSGRNRSGTRTLSVLPDRRNVDIPQRFALTSRRGTFRGNRETVATVEVGQVELREGQAESTQKERKKTLQA
jgi:hypothetical protein